MFVRRKALPFRKQESPISMDVNSGLLFATNSSPCSSASSSIRMLDSWGKLDRWRPETFCNAPFLREIDLKLGSSSNVNELQLAANEAPSSKVVRTLILRIEKESSPENRLSPKMSVSKWFAQANPSKSSCLVYEKEPTVALPILSSLKLFRSITNGLC